MKIENRIRGMVACLVLAIIGFVMFTFDPLREIGLMIIMFSAGFALRETMEGKTE